MIPKFKIFKHIWPAHFLKFFMKKILKTVKLKFFNQSLVHVSNKTSTSSNSLFKCKVMSRFTLKNRNFIVSVRKLENIYYVLKIMEINNNNKKLIE